MLNLVLLRKFSMDFLVLGCQMSHVSAAGMLILFYSLKQKFRKGPDLESPSQFGTREANQTASAFLALTLFFQVSCDQRQNIRLARSLAYPFLHNAICGEILIVKHLQKGLKFQNICFATNFLNLLKLWTSVYFFHIFWISVQAIK